MCMLVHVSPTSPYNILKQNVNSNVFIVCIFVSILKSVVVFEQQIYNSCLFNDLYFPQVVTLVKAEVFYVCMFSGISSNVVTDTLWHCKMLNKRAHAYILYSISGRTLSTPLIFLCWPVCSSIILAAKLCNSFYHRKYSIQAFPK